MKKWIAVFIVILMATSVFADNTERIKELTTEATQLQQRLQQYQRMTQNIQVRLIQLNAIILELREQDLKVVEEPIAE